MNQLPDDYGAVDIMRDPERLVKVMRFAEQLMNLEVRDGSGVIRRIQRTPRSLNAVLDIGTAESTLAVVPMSAWRGQSTCSEETSAAIADATHAAIEAASYKDKIIALWPFLGCDIGTFCIPLIDRLGVGPATNNGFLDSDIDQTLGIRGNGTGKYLNSHLLPSDLGANGAGGLGWWENGWMGAGNVEPMGCYKQSTIPDNRFCIDVRAATRVFRWGTSTETAGSGTGASNGHWYGQSENASLRKFYQDAVSIGISTTTASILGIGDNEILMCGCNEGFSAGSVGWPGRGLCAYFTSGNLTDVEILAFHILLQKYLITPKETGIPVPFIAVSENYSDPSHPDNVAETDCESCIAQVVVADDEVVCVNDEIVTSDI